MMRRVVLYRNIFLNTTRKYSDVNPTAGSSASTVNPQPQMNPNVPGLSSSVVLPASDPVGPGVDPNKSSAYKVPEYYCYDNMSFFEAEIEMAKYRLPAPSALKK